MRRFSERSTGVNRHGDDAEAGQVSQDPARRDQGQRPAGQLRRLRRLRVASRWTRGWLSAEAIEAGRITAAHSVRGEGRLFIRVFPHKSVTAIPLETRMGKGKGEPEFWAAVIRPGQVLFELAGLPEAAARDTLAKVAYKMPFKCRFVRRQAAK